MIYVSFGLEKAGSTLTANLTRLILERCGHPHMPLSSRDRGDVKGSETRSRGEQTNNIKDWSPEVVSAVDRLIPADRIVMLRTHSGPGEAILRLIGEGRGICHVALRDLRDVALSMMDVVARKEKLGRPNLTGIVLGEIESTFAAMRGNLDSAYRWGETPGVLFLDYENTAFRPEITIDAICRQLGLDLPRAEYDAIFTEAAANPNGKLNVGVSRRHRREMSARDQAAVLAEFADYYARFYPDAAVTVDAGAASAEG
ncbi:hypothetical protein [Zavarzinia aquatilis]|uniref:Sulfotransferase family protein n=1 Tax=Zavarzinia aquatilis TaxID=2211142 RepID=A0A317E757_9PROT|nr:hypothetical protein [Zavarzinia aquatilis]PWR22839.1 hypothetical protein DKG74_10470 [Zavarzinia aquatilis]